MQEIVDINKVIGENEKCVFYFMEKKHMNFLGNPIDDKHLFFWDECPTFPSNLQITLKSVRYIYIVTKTPELNMGVFTSQYKGYFIGENAGLFPKP